MSDDPTVREVYERWKAQKPSAQAIIAAEIHEAWKAEQPTLRDRFAMAAPWEYLVAVAERLQAEMERVTAEESEASTCLAADAYNYADAMLAERAKK